MQVFYLQNYIFVLNVLLALIMLVYNIRSNRNILFLFFFLLFAAIIQLLHQTLFFDGSKYLFAFLYHNFSPLVFLTGPAIFMFFRKLLNPRLQFKRIELLHLLPFLVQFISVTPYILTSFDYKLQIAHHILENPSEILQVDLKLLYPNMLNAIFKLISNSSYVVLSLIMLYRYHRKLIRQKKLNWNKHDRNLIWIWFFLMIILIVYFLHFGAINSMIFDKNIEQQNEILHTLAVINQFILLTIPTSILLFPHVLTELKVKQLDRSTVKLSSDDCMSLEDEIRSYMQDQQPFLETKFNRNDLCKALNISLQQMQQCLNGSSAKTFVELKNEYRIDYSIELLKREQSKEFTLEAIANQSGFNSYSNYFTIFKEVQGITPKQWIKANLQG